MKQQLRLKTILPLFLFCVYGFKTAAQAPVTHWDKTFGGSSVDVLTSLVPTSDGGYIIGGSSESGISGDKTQANKGFLSDYWILKLDAAGNKVWDRTIGGSFDDGLQSMAQVSGSQFIFGGTSNSGISGDKTQPSKGNSDYWIVLADITGNKLWDKTIGGDGFENLTRILQTSDGGYIIGGTSDSGISGDKTQLSRGGNDYWIVKLNAAGNILWDKTFGGSNSDVLQYIIQTADGGYLAGGNSDSGISGDKTQASKGGSDFWVVKLDANGNKLWDKAYGGSLGDGLNSLAQTADGGYILGGNSASPVSGDKTQPSKGSEDYWLVKIDPAGLKTWDKTIGGSGSDNLKSLARTFDGGYVLGGISASGISGDKTQLLKGLKDYWVVKVDDQGNTLWDLGLGGSSNNWLISLYQTTSDNYILAGMSDSGISGDKTQANRGNWDYWMIKLGSSASVGIPEPFLNADISISPNPSQGKFQLQLNHLTTKSAEVTVSDLLGRIVYQQKIPVTQKQINQEINLPKVKAMYLLQVKAGEAISTRKIIVE